MTTAQPTLDPTPPIQRWQGATPLIMSLIVLGMIVADLIRYGFHAPHHDEGTADHIAMLLMFGQLPIMLSLAVSGWKEWPRVRPVLMLQIGLWGLVFFLTSLS